MENRFKAKDLRVRQGESGELFISVYDCYNAEFGFCKETLVTSGYEIAYRVFATASGCTYDYQNDEDAKKYGTVYNFETTVSRLIGDTIEEEQTFSPIQLRVLEREINEKAKRMYTHAYTVQEHDMREYRFLTPGQVMLGKVVSYNGDESQYLKLITLDKKHKILYDFGTGNYYYVGADYDYKVLPNADGLFVEMSLDDLQGVKSSNYLDSVDIAGINYDVLRKNMAEKEPIQPAN